MSDLILPPLLNAIETTEPFLTSIEKVRKGKAGAGDVFWRRDKHVADFSIILEPDVVQQRALEMSPLAMVALSDCLAVILPPQVAVQFRSDTEVVVNGGTVGGIKTSMAKTGTDQDVPDWLVHSISIGLIRKDNQQDPGFEPDITTLDEEGWELPESDKFIETYARHFLSWLAVWNEDGFAPIARAWKFKAENEREPDLESVTGNISLFESKI